MGVFKDKEYDRIAGIMGPLASMIYTVDLPDGKRGLPAEELAEGTEGILSLCEVSGKIQAGREAQGAEAVSAGQEGRDSMSQQSSVDCAVQAALLEAKEK